MFETGFKSLIFFTNYMHVNFAYLHAQVCVWLCSHSSVHSLTSCSLVSRLSLYVHIYCVTFDPHEERDSSCGSKVMQQTCTRGGEPGNEAIPVVDFLKRFRDM